MSLKPIRMVLGKVEPQNSNVEELLIKLIRDSELRITAEIDNLKKLITINGDDIRDFKTRLDSRITLDTIKIIEAIKNEYKLPEKKVTVTTEKKAEVVTTKQPVSSSINITELGKLVVSSWTGNGNPAFIMSQLGHGDLADYSALTSAVKAIVSSNGTDMVSRSAILPVASTPKFCKFVWDCLDKLASVPDIATTSRIDMLSQSIRRFSKDFSVPADLIQEVIKGLKKVRKKSDCPMAWDKEASDYILAEAFGKDLRGYPALETKNFLSFLHSQLEADYVS